MGEVDPAFIQDLEHQPRLDLIDAGSIPLIDLSPVSSPDDLLNPVLEASIAGLVAEIREACRDWGFFQVINSGVPPESRRRVEAAAREFFALSLEEKRKVVRDEVRVMGYYDKEHTKNVRDWKEVFDFVVGSPPQISAGNGVNDIKSKELINLWPEYPTDFREVCKEYIKEAEKLSFKLLGLISLSLGLPANRLDGLFKEQTSFARLNHYPPCPAPHLALGVGTHTDPGALTVLAQDDVGGLQVKCKANGEWILVKPTPDGYIIDVGDIIQVWSNDAYESVEHRVKLNSEKERFSIPFFLNPAHHVNVRPLEELTTEKNVPAKYKEYNWGKFSIARKDGNFKKLDAEYLQIYHFKV